MYIVKAHIILGISAQNNWWQEAWSVLQKGVPVVLVSTWFERVPGRSLLPDSEAPRCQKTQFFLKARHWRVTTDIWYSEYIYTDYFRVF